MRIEKKGREIREKGLVIYTRVRIIGSNAKREEAGEKKE